MAARFFIFLPLIILIPDIYIWFCGIYRKRTNWKYLHWVSLLAAIVAAIGSMSARRNGMFAYILMVIVIAGYLPKIVYTVVSIPFRIASHFRKSIGKIGNIVAITLSVIFFGCMVFGLTRGWRQIAVKEVVITSDRLPDAFDGYRIVQLSDLHLGTFHYTPGFISDVVTRVNWLNPDMICFTGDIVNLRAGEMGQFIDVLSELSAPDGIYSIMGNHDYCEYYDFDSPDGAMHDVELIVQMERSMGWRLLLNNHTHIVRGQDSIALVGVENCGEPPFKSYSNLPKALRGLPMDEYKVLLSHNPVHWRKEVLDGSNVDLMLAGHTHAMQFRIGPFSPSALRYKEWGGLYKEGDRALYVNTGTGGNFLFRFGAWPEITVITLRKGGK